MVLHFNVKGESRKAMVKAIEKELGVKARLKSWYLLFIHLQKLFLWKALKLFQQFNKTKRFT